MITSRYSYILAGFKRWLARGVISSITLHHYFVPGKYVISRLVTIIYLIRRSVYYILDINNPKIFCRNVWGGAAWLGCQSYLITPSENLSDFLKAVWV